MKCLKFTPERGNDWSGNRPLARVGIRIIVQKTNRQLSFTSGINCACVE